MKEEPLYGPTYMGDIYVASVIKFLFNAKDSSFYLLKSDDQDEKETIFYIDRITAHRLYYIPISDLKRNVLKSTLELASNLKQAYNEEFLNYKEEYMRAYEEAQKLLVLM